MKRRHAIVLGMTLSLLAIMGLALSYVILPILASGSPIEFDRTFWQSGTLTDRGRMARGLESSRLLVGLPRTQVEAMLGSPDERLNLSLSYRVDFGHRFGSDPWLYMLRIEFNQDDKATRAYLHD